MEKENRIKFIEIVFENCEVAKLKPNMFKYFYMSGIHNTLSINCYQYEKGEWDKHLSCDYFSIEILKKGLDQILSMEEVTLKEHLERWSNITSVYITYKDNTEESYYVPWPDEEDYNNTYQKLTPGLEDNSLRITICKENKLNEEVG